MHPLPFISLALSGRNDLNVHRSFIGLVLRLNGGHTAGLPFLGISLVCLHGFIRGGTVRGDSAEPDLPELK